MTSKTSDKLFENLKDKFMSGIAHFVRAKVAKERLEKNILNEQLDYQKEQN